MSTSLHGACRGPRLSSVREALPRWPWLPKAETTSALQCPSSQLAAPHTEAGTAFLLLSPQHRKWPLPSSRAQPPSRVPVSMASFLDPLTQAAISRRLTGHSTSPCL